MNKKFMLSGLFAASILAVVGVVAFAQTPTSAALFADTPSGEWHHYHAQNPSLNGYGKAVKGTKEYWVECGGGYQYDVPEAGTKVYETVAPDTSEFTRNDDRWSYYCDVHGHDYDSLGVCTHCNALQNAVKIADKAVASASVADEDPTLGFNSVYAATGLSNGNNGTSVDVSGYSVLYFSLWHDIGNILVFGGGDNNPILWQADWYNILLTNDGTGWVAHYKRAYETSWNSDRTKVDNATGQDFSSILRLYNWSDLSTANVKCTELYTCHTPDTNGICTDCLELVGGTKVADTVFSQTVAPDSNPAAPAGFKSSVKVVAHHNTNACVASIDISSYTKLYFAVRASYNTQYFSGSGKSFWTDRWNYIYLEKVDSTWHAYGRDPGETEFTELSIDSQSTNVKYMFKVVCWDCSSDDFNMFTTELIGL